MKYQHDNKDITTSSNSIKILFFNSTTAELSEFVSNMAKKNLFTVFLGSIITHLAN